MFHLYFGAFDLVLYGLALLFAIVFSEVICKELDSHKTIGVTSSGTSQVLDAQPQMISASDVQTNVPLILHSSLYELHGTIVCKVDTLPIELPQEFPQFQLRGESVVKLMDLQALHPTVAIDAQQVLEKWQQWKGSSQPSRKTKKRSRIVASAGTVKAATA